MSASPGWLRENVRVSNVRVPDAIAERIVAAVRSMMPPDFDIELRGRSVMLRPADQ